MRESIVTSSVLGLFMVFAGMGAGCAGGDGGRHEAGASQRVADDLEKKPSAGRLPGRLPGGVVAYVNGTAVRGEVLWGPLIEAAGGRVLEEVVLDELLRARLVELGVTLSAAEISAELSALSDALSDDADEAARLLTELRRRRGLGDDRFDRLLRRNAGLRRLVSKDVVVSDLQVKRAFVRRHGVRYRVRLITADTAPQAQRLRERALAGEVFGELAARHSTDASAAQGGLLSPVSVEDATYPQAFRNTLPGLDAQRDGGLSEILALEGGYAVLKLEEVLEAEAVAFEEVRAALRAAARRQNARLLMDQQARALLSEADVLVLDPGIKRGWESRGAGE